MSRVVKTALLIVAHGSRVPAANGEMLRLARAVGALEPSPFATVSTAFLQSGTPSVDGELTRLATAGFDKIVILPCLLSAGRHVAVDIPQMVDTFQTRLPAVDIVVAPHLALAEDFPRFLLARAVEMF